MALLTSESQAQAVTDYDGNVYDTVHIGTQIWTVPNLKVTHYRNGDPIPNVTDSAIWYNLTSGAYCNYDNDTNNAADYGRLYNWYAVQDPRGIAPLGWHVPTFEDWDTLQIFLGYDLIAGGKLKEIGTAHWMSPNTGASDEYDFTALPGGQRADSIYSGTFSEITQQGYWWSSSEMDTTYPWGVNISYNSEGFTNWAASTRKSGFSIRLISDIPLNINTINKSALFNIYPNPAIDRVIITNAYTQKVNMAIYNMAGSILMQQELTANKNSIDISSLAPGMYLIKLFNAEWTVYKKLMKKE
jgi:uncharacterized protein (TIGR02145 family)